MNDSDLGSANSLCLLESESEDTLRGLTCDELDGLDNTVDNHVFNARIFTLGVFSNQNRVDIVVGGFESSDRSAWSQIGEEVESSAKSKIEGDVTLTNRCLGANYCQENPLNANSREVG